MMLIFLLFYIIGVILAFGLITGGVVEDYLSTVYIDYPEESHPIFNPRIVFFSFGSWFIVAGVLSGANKLPLFRFSYKDIYERKK